MIDTAHLLASTDLLALAGETVRLKKQGAQHYALCPLHADRSPTLRIDPKKGLWYCPACVTGGNAIDWLTKTRGLSFRDAAAELARRAGIDATVPKSEQPILAPRAPAFPAPAVEPLTPWGGQHLLSPDNRPVHVLNEFPGRAAYLRLVETVWPDDDVVWYPRRGISADAMYLAPIAMRVLWIEATGLADRYRAEALLRAVEAWRGRYLAAGRDTASPSTPLQAAGMAPTPRLATVTRHDAAA